MSQKAIISDIHANLEALDVVFEDIKKRKGGIFDWKVRLLLKFNDIFINVFDTIY